MQAVFRPASARPKAARRPAPPAPLICYKLLIETNQSRENAHYDSIVFMLNEGVFAG